MGAVGRVDGNQHGADAGGGELGHNPFGVVGGPQGNVIALFDAQGHQATGNLVALFLELSPGVAQVPVHVDQGIPVAEPVGLSVQQVSDGHFQVGGAGHDGPPYLDYSPI